MGLPGYHLTSLRERFKPLARVPATLPLLSRADSGSYSIVRSDIEGTAAELLMDGDLFWVILVVPVILAIAVAVVFSLLKPPARARVERRKRMRELAGRLGLRYYGSAQSADLSSLPAFSLLQKGAVKAVTNLMGEQRRPPRLLLFDYEYRQARGRMAADPVLGALYLVIVARLLHPVQSAPVRIFREDWFGGPVGVKGLYRVQFRSDPTFSREYSIKGGVPERVRAMLTDRVREAIRSWTGKGPRPVIEVLPDWVVVYVESDLYDKDLTLKGAELLRYASSIAVSLGGAAGAAAATLRAESAPP